jgi:hypothetical protein
MMKKRAIRIGVVAAVIAGAGLMAVPANATEPIGTPPPWCITANCTNPFPVGQ